jgi:hypothetical protein
MSSRVWCRGMGPVVVPCHLPLVFGAREGVVVPVVMVCVPCHLPLAFGQGGGGGATMGGWVVGTAGHSFGG